MIPLSTKQSIFYVKREGNRAIIVLQDSFPIDNRNNGIYPLFCRNRKELEDGILHVKIQATVREIRDAILEERAFCNNFDSMQNAYGLFDFEGKRSETRCKLYLSLSELDEVGKIFPEYVKAVRDKEEYFANLKQADSFDDRPAEEQDEIRRLRGNLDRLFEETAKKMVNMTDIPFIKTKFQ